MLTTNRKFGKMREAEKFAPRAERYNKSAGLYKNGIGVINLYQKKAVTGYGKICLRRIHAANDLFKLLQTNLSAANLQHCSYKAPDHSPEKTIGLNMIYKTFILFFPLAF